MAEGTDPAENGTPESHDDEESLEGNVANDSGSESSGESDAEDSMEDAEDDTDSSKEEALADAADDDSADEQASGDDTSGSDERDEGLERDSEEDLAIDAGSDDNADLCDELAGEDDAGSADVTEEGNGGEGELEVEDALPGDDTEAGPGLERAVHVAEGHLKSVLESLIFVADKPVKARQLARAAKAKVAEVRPLLEELQSDYSERGIHLIEVASGFQFRSALSSAPFVRDFVSRKPVRLSRAQLETLAIVAYRQPVTRPEIDDIRGVDSGASLKMLVDRDLIKVLGRKDEPGRPLLYGTSPNFLEFFGLTSLKDLPTLKEFTELSDESRGIFERRMGEKVDFSEAEQEAQAAEAAAQEAMFGDEDEDDEESEASSSDGPEADTENGDAERDQADEEGEADHSGAGEADADDDTEGVADADEEDDDDADEEDDDDADEEDDDDADEEDEDDE